MRYHPGIPVMKPLVIVGVLLAMAGVTLESQVQSIPAPGQRPPLMSLVSGQVVDDTGRLIEKATVRLVGAGAMWTRLTDRSGRFLYENVPAGAYVLTVSKAGYFDGAYGKRRHAGTPLPFEIAATQSLGEMKVQLFRGCVITGSVFDEGSEPIAGARVIAFRRDFVEGEWRYTSSGTAVTDDRGDFRVFGLEPGEYIVSTPTTQANTSEGEVLTATMVDVENSTAYPSLFYPAARYFPLALPLLLGSGEVRYAVDFRWSPVIARAVSGRLIGEDATISQQVVRLVAFDSQGEGFGTETAITLSAPDGSFTFQRVPAGDYRLEAGTAFTGQAEAATAVTWGRADVSVVDVDIAALEVKMEGGRSIAGAVTFPASTSRQDSALSRVGVTLVPAAPGLTPPSKIAVQSDGTFTRGNLVPGPYYIRVGVTPPGTYVRSISGGGRDALDTPVDLTEHDLDDIEITLTDRGTEIIGSVRDGRLMQIPGAAVIVMSAHDRQWTPNRTRYLRASTAGSFTITGLPPGEYLIVAIDDALAEGWQDARVLTQLRTLATRIALREAESRTLELRLSAFKR